jgi:hypothetical protein
MVEQIQTTPPYDVVNSLASAQADAKAAAHQSASSQTTIPPKKEQDTVTLSASVQASQLYLQGNSVTQIAALLGLPTTTVDNDLNINPANATSTVQAATTAQSGATNTPSDASTPYTAASSPYTEQTQTTGQVS